MQSYGQDSNKIRRRYNTDEISKFFKKVDEKRERKIKDTGIKIPYTYKCFLEQIKPVMKRVVQKYCLMILQFELH